MAKSDWQAEKTKHPNSIHSAKNIFASVCAGLLCLMVLDGSVDDAERFKTDDPCWICKLQAGRCKAVDKKNKASAGPNAGRFVAMLAI